eukprot:COSAG06_NODE_19727_length_825_cov_0.815427_1_plen_69_part_10
MQFGPGVNVARIANGGRSFEYLSGEDPYLGEILRHTPRSSFAFSVTKRSVLPRQAKDTCVNHGLFLELC